MYVDNLTLHTPFSLIKSKLRRYIFVVFNLLFMKLNSIAILAFCCCWMVNAQMDITKGFSLLDSGQFKEASIFFEAYLKEDPLNKSARICYGRAFGLSGKPEEAITYFEAMKADYPNDYEIESNWCEAFLWARKFKEAKPHYQQLVKNNPDKFGAVLGLANTLSNLQEYNAALEWVNKAIAMEPENEGAKVSRKYIYLGYAYKLSKIDQFIPAENLLNKVFIDFPEDKQGLQNLANLFLMSKEYDKQIATYKRLATTHADSITALNGISLAYHLKEDDKSALNSVLKAKKKVDMVANHPQTEDTYNRYIQALIWNQKYVVARKKIDSLEKHFPNSNWLTLLRSTLGMYTGDFKTSITNYDVILERDSTSFDGNMGKANAMFANDNLVPAYENAFNTLKIYENQKDAVGFIEKLNLQNTPTAEEWLQYTFDNGNNIAYAATTTVDIPISPKFKTGFLYQYRNSENEITVNKASSHTFTGTASYKLVPRVNLIASGGVYAARFLDTTYITPLLDVKLQTKPLKLNSLELNYKREVQAFNAELIKREIIMNHYGLTYNLGTNFNLGWYTQAMYTTQTDENVRQLLFTSLYYNLFKKPAFKFGVNFQYLSFKNQVPTIYFSPSIYKNMELFFDLRGDLSKKTKGYVSAAGGLQQVEQDDMTVIYRAEGGLTHAFTKRLSLTAYGKYSNIASAIGAGFQFTEMGLRLKWNITEKPLFFNQLFGKDMALLEN